jgi:hypothetical protein
MPRNRDKLCCQVPGCGSWAMRGHTLCRSHRDVELGPRGGGAPQDNLNALTTGQHAHPLSGPVHDRLAQLILHQPDQLPQHIALATQIIHDHTGDPYKTIVALRAFLSDVVPPVAGGLFIAEMRTFLGRLPPANRAPFLHLIRTNLGRRSNVGALLFLRAAIRIMEKRQKTNTGAPAIDREQPPLLETDEQRRPGP